MSNISSSVSSEKQKNQVSNSQYEQNINVGLTYALGPFPDEPLLSIIDKTLLLSSRFWRYSNFQNENQKKHLSFSYGTDCPKQSLSKLPNISASCPDLTTLSSGETLKEKIDFPSKVSSHSNIAQQCCKSRQIHESDIAEKCLKRCSDINDIVEQCPVTVSNDNLNRMRVEEAITQNGLKSYEIWSEDICKDSPSMVIILSPNGDVIPFAYLNKE